MKNHCIQCKERIDQLDFYMETKHGRICSACLIRRQREEGHEPGETIKSLFQQPKRPSPKRSEAEKQVDKLRAMSALQLRYSLQ